MWHSQAKRVVVLLGCLSFTWACSDARTATPPDATATDASSADSAPSDAMPEAMGSDSMPFDAKRPEFCSIIGHRGAAGLFPENTVSGFRNALALGVAGVELDVRMSADGHAVLMHDATVDRTTDGTGAVSELTLAELQQLDAGQGEPVPTLEQALAVLEPQHILLCEFKGAGTERSAFEAVRDAGLLGNTFFTSFYPERLSTLRGFAPNAKIGVLLNEVDEATLRDAAELRPDLLNLHFSIVNEESVEQARAISPLIRVFNPDDEAEQRRVCALGIDYLGTNRPDIALGWLTP